MTPTDEQIDALTKLINFGVSKGADVLNAMLESTVDLHIPSLNVISSSELKDTLGELGDDELLAVNLPFKGKFSGIAELILPAKSVSGLVAALTGEEIDDDFESLKEGSLNEVGNIVLNGVMGTIGNALKIPLSFSTPYYVEGKAEQLPDLSKVSSKSVTLVARTNFHIKKFKLEGNIVLFFEEGSFNTLLEGLVLSGIMVWNK